MMTLIFALMCVALFLAWRGSPRAALVCLLVTLAFSIGLFLFEIYNPEYGFRMPWIQVSAPFAPGEG
jgi:hypothetical protein